MQQLQTLMTIFHAAGCALRDHSIFFKKNLSERLLKRSPSGVNHENPAHHYRKDNFSSHLHVVMSVEVDNSRRLKRDGEIYIIKSKKIRLKSK